MKEVRKRPKKKQNTEGNAKCAGGKDLQIWGTSHSLKLKKLVLLSGGLKGERMRGGEVGGAGGGVGWWGGGGATG